MGSSEGAPLLIATEDHAIALLHDDWAVRGHGMVVARRHVENLSALSAAERDGMVDLYTRFERALLEVLGVERVMMLKLGIAVPHLHWHLYPVSAGATREDVFRAFDSATRDEPDTGRKLELVERLRRRVAQ